MCEIEIDLILGSRSTLTCFLCGGQNRRRFVCGPRTTWFSNVWIEIDLVFSVGIEIVWDYACGPKMTCF